MLTAYHEATAIVASRDYRSDPQGDHHSAQPRRLVMQLPGATSCRCRWSQ
jgi:hypothetical protein